ncbi:hypothetical protein [Streptococcus loxodontisalivarius]|uniref:Uncharacterized protein n=1 Tax=Streptococcus loxodontisalivarius TaxID=1349415 RepID=A0ABS2PPU9_9STRE|nr:hypothetical protein [Streptococcus loxodontisalivarius]MBM7642059.1 hypothetical protein [Streptococcus loxodontisalivarius]
MSSTVKQMIYLKNNRIILTLDLKEYDVTDCINEVIDELKKLKAR